MDMLASLLAVGIDPRRSVLFHQDMVSDFFCGYWTLILDSESSSACILESSAYRACLDIKLPRASWETSPDDYLEGTPFMPILRKQN